MQDMWRPRPCRYPRARGDVPISAELPRVASHAAAAGGTSRPARRRQQAAAGHDRAGRPAPRRPASAFASSRRPSRHVEWLLRPDRGHEGRDRGRATRAPYGRGASLRQQCSERCGTAGGTSRPPARHRRRRTARQLPPAPRARLLGTGPPHRRAPATRRRDVQPNAEPVRGCPQAGDDGKRALRAQGRRRQRRTSPKPATSQSAKRWSPN
jgi:hypothetical protein